MVVPTAPHLWSRAAALHSAAQFPRRPLRGRTSASAAATAAAACAGWIKGGGVKAPASETSLCKSRVAGRHCAGSGAASAARDADGKAAASGAGAPPTTAAAAADAAWAPARGASGGS
eukprot:294386-Chlamydomonas_euryale.AAC.1